MTEFEKFIEELPHKLGSFCKPCQDRGARLARDWILQKAREKLESRCDCFVILEELLK